MHLPTNRQPSWTIRSAPAACWSFRNPHEVDRWFVPERNCLGRTKLHQVFCAWQTVLIPPKSSKIQAYPSHLSQKSMQDFTKSDSKIGVQLYLFQNQSFHASNGSLTGLLSSDAAELHFVPPPGNRRKTRQARLKSHGEMDETIVTMILNYSKTFIIS